MKHHRRSAAALAVFACAALCAAARAASFPLKGLVLWPDQAADHPELQDAVSLEFLYFTPSRVAVAAAPGGGIVYDWSALDSILDGMASRGHQAVLRFRYEYPDETVPEYPGVRGATGVPKFVKALPGYKETFARNPGGDGPTWYADWSHPGLKAFALRFISDFAERYDKDPRIAFFEAGFGHWGEYHVHGTDVRLGVNFPDKDFQREYMEILAEKLRETPWCVSIDAAQEKYSDLARDPALRALPFGLFDDSFMHSGHDIGSKGDDDGWNERCWLEFGADRWKRAPCGGEISYYEKKDQRQFLDPRGLHGVTWERAAAKYHISFMVANDSLDGRFGTPARFREAALACGWRFRFVGASVEPAADAGAGAVLVVEIANDGVAPAYHDVRAAVGAARSEETLKGLLPGETRKLRVPVPPAAGTGPPDAGALSAGVTLVSLKLYPGATLPLER